MRHNHVFAKLDLQQFAGSYIGEQENAEFTPQDKYPTG